MVQPSLVYISQPNEYGLLYSKAELAALRGVCGSHDLRIYVDGARLAYALGAPDNDVSLKDLSRLADAFYIGGTKCGTLFGEALAFPRHDTVPRFFTIVMQRGALLAKRRLLGVQFEALFEDGLYGRIGQAAVAQARRITSAFGAAGCVLAHPSQTNQVSPILRDEQLARLNEAVVTSFWEKPDLEHTVVRLAMSWASTDAGVDSLTHALASGVLG